MGVIIIIAVFWLFGLLDGMEHVRRRGTSRPTYGREPPRPVNGFKRAGWNTKA